MLLAKDSGQHLNLMHFSKSCMHYTPYKTGSELDHLMFDVADAKIVAAHKELVAAKEATIDLVGRLRSAWYRDPAGVGRLQPWARIGVLSQIWTPPSAQVVE